MPCVGHPSRKHFCDARFIVMEVDTSVMIILYCHVTLLRQHRYDYLDSTIKSSWMYMHDRKRDLLWQTRIITEVYFLWCYTPPPPTSINPWLARNNGCLQLTTVLGEFCLQLFWFGLSMGLGIPVTSHFLVSEKRSPLLLRITHLAWKI